MQQPAPLREGETARNWAVVLHGAKKITKEPRAFPDDPPAGFVQINVKNCGICGSDLHAFEEGQMLGFKIPLPMVLGHEASGIITKVGPGVENVKVGQRVAIHPATYYMLLANHINHPAQLCFPLPDGVSYEDGAFVEPLAVGLHAVKRGNVTKGSKVVILGAGPIGLSSLASAKALGAARVVVTDLEDSRLKSATAGGADAVLNTKGMSPADAAVAICELFKTEAPKAGDGGDISLDDGWQLGVMDGSVDSVIDAAGFSQSIATAVYTVKPKGTISVVGLGSPAPTTPLLAAAVKEVDIRPCMAYGECYPEALQLIADKKVDVSKFISHRLSMDEAQHGFEICLANKDGAVKVMFHTD